MENEDIQRAAVAGAMAPLLPLVLYLINRALYWGGYLLGRLSRKLARRHASAAGREQA